MRSDLQSLNDLMAPIKASLEELVEYQEMTDRSRKSLPPKAGSTGARGDYIQVNDPLVSRSHLLERKVHECLNKLNCQKQTNYLSPRNAQARNPPHEQAVSYRSPIELEFKKKKIHFVSDFRLYDERWQLKLMQH